MKILRVEHNRRRLRMHVHVCEGRLERGRGLLFRRCPDWSSAFMLQQCSAIHTFGMTYSIDALFCDQQGRILRVVEGLAPWRTVRVSGANSVWELRAGAAALWGWRTGDQVLPC
jgi:uncharacterized protein